MGKANPFNEVIYLPVGCEVLQTSGQRSLVYSTFCYICMLFGMVKVNLLIAVIIRANYRERFLYNSRNYLTKNIAETSAS